MVQNKKLPLRWKGRGASGRVVLKVARHLNVHDTGPCAVELNEQDSAPLAQDQYRSCIVVAIHDEGDACWKEHRFHMGTTVVALALAHRLGIAYREVIVLTHEIAWKELFESPRDITVQKVLVLVEPDAGSRVLALHEDGSFDEPLPLHGQDDVVGDIDELHSFLRLEGDLHSSDVMNHRGTSVVVFCFLYVPHYSRIATTCQKKIIDKGEGSGTITPK